MADTTFGQGLLTFLEDDSILAFAPAIITYLTNFQAAQGDPIKQQLALIQLQGNLVQAVPGAESSFLSQIAQLILNKVLALQAAAKTA